MINSQPQTGAVFHHRKSGGGGGAVSHVNPLESSVTELYQEPYLDMHCRAGRKMPLSILFPARLSSLSLLREVFLFVVHKQFAPGSQVVPYPAVLLLLRGKEVGAWARWTLPQSPCWV